MSGVNSITTKQWITTWLESVAGGSSPLSQRSLSSIEKHGGLGAAIVMAVEKNVHLLLVEDEAGREIVAASKRPFKVIC